MSKSTPVKPRKNGLKAQKESWAWQQTLRKKLFQEAAEEDLEGLKSTDIAVLVGMASAFIETKTPGIVKIRLVDHVSETGALAHRSVLEILNDDMPFLVDSVVNELTRRGLTVLTVLHPILSCTRDKNGKLIDIGKVKQSDGQFLSESYIHIHLDGLAASLNPKSLLADLQSILDEVRAAVLDWKPMQRVVEKSIEQLRGEASPLPTAIISETIDFLNWLLDNKFTFLGMCQYHLVKKNGDSQMVADTSSALGILRLNKQKVVKNAASRVTSLYKSGYALLVEKSDIVSRIHRPVVMDYVGLYQFDSAGKVIGELRIVGLFASSAYTQAASSIPLLRRRIEAVVSLCGLAPGGHSGKGLLSILEKMSRDDLFQIESEQLAPLAMGMWRLQERPRTRVFIRVDRFQRYVIAYVFFPRDRFSSELREKAGNILEAKYRGKILEFMPDFGEGTLVRVRYIISLGLSADALPDPAKLEREIVEATRGWADELSDALVKLNGKAEASAIAARYAGAFPAAYRDAHGVQDALADINVIESLNEKASTSIEFARPIGDHGAARLKLFHLATPVSLSARLPLLEDMGLRALDENTYVIHPVKDGGKAEAVYIHEVALNRDGGLAIDPSSYKLLEECFSAVWSRKADSDALNGLVLAASLSWQEVSVLRAFVRYLRQTGFAYLLSSIARTLLRYSDITRLLIDLFNVRFQPDYPKAGTLQQREILQARVLEKLEELLVSVPSLDDDRTIRYIAGAIMATVRTNFFGLEALQGNIPIALAMKINSKQVPGIPAPVPHAEIFVHSTLVEGVHLRAGMIARGGLRWSDRPADFRTEVLGLAKAQNVKNSVIVPVGAKGGFIPRQLPVGGTRDEIYLAGTLAYQSFVSSLLSVTDNAKGSKILPPAGIIRHDGDDPYLVVAADKGTAAFSDVANAISTDAGFWLDDAFASGGSAGYDHKKMGITARGGWEAVKRHFREMDRDIQTTPFTVVGVGDMSGDVFGNGMLLSQQTRLLAAFDHRDIFIDPDPDPAISFAERKRLFELPRSSWQDYDSKLISQGGGIFSRSEKQITLTPQIKALTGLTQTSVTPNELMSAIVMADADLLWFGGIGTYVRASSENDADVGDKANDAIRVVAKSLRVKVIGEGANLGMTQLARIEFTQVGGRINTDAIDNSAGVNSSDVEVNLKIALGAAEAAGKLKRSARNKLLSSMTDQVADIVLRNNYLQTLCLSLADQNFSKDRSGIERLFRRLETRGGLNRAIEFLPTSEELEERINKGGSLTRPEMAVLVAYAKIVLFNDMMAQKVADDPYLEKELLRYFPQQMTKAYQAEISAHKLRAEIISTLLANSIVNRCGPEFMFDLCHDSGVSIGALSRHYALARDGFGFVNLNDSVDKLDNKLAGNIQLGLYAQLQEDLRHAVEWFSINETSSEGLSVLVPAYKEGLETIVKGMDTILTERPLASLKREVSRIATTGLGKQEATWIASLPYLVRALDVVQIAKLTKKPVLAAAKTYFGISGLLSIDEVLSRSQTISSDSDYDRQAIAGIKQSVQRSVRSIVTQVIQSGLSDIRQSEFKQAGEEISRIANEPGFSLAKFAVISSQLGSFAKV